MTALATGPSSMPSLDSRFRGNDIALKLFSVMPALRLRSGQAPAGIQDLLLLRVTANEIHSSRLLKNPPFTLRQAQGERREACNRWRFSVRAEPVEARIRLFQQPAKPDGKRFVHYGYTSCSLRPTLKRRAQRTKPGKPGSQGASAPFVT